MCGIVGFLSTTKGQNYKAKSDWMRLALIADTIRGHHSTGVFNVPFDNKRSDGTADWCKATYPGPVFVQSDDFRKRNRNAEQYRYFVGHNRFATMGKSDDVDNAHPFQEGPITLVHNGTLSSQYHLPHRDKYKAQVDSHAICHNLALSDVDNAKEVLEQLAGSYTLVWHDARDNSLNVTRNSQRPLSMMQGADGTIYFASEGGMVTWIASRIGVQMNPLYTPKVGVHLKWMPDELVPEVLPFQVYTYNNYWHTGYDDIPYRATSYGGSNATSGGSKSKPSDKGLPKIKEPSEVQRREISEAGYDPEEIYPFWPYEVHGYKDRKLRLYQKVRCTIGVVNGMVFEDAAVILGGISKAMFESKWTRSDDDCWAVRVIGIKWTSDAATGKPEKVLVCKVVSWDFQEDDLPDDYGQACWFPGPNGQGMDARQWLDATSKGCAHCGMSMLLADAEDTIWTKDNDPICPDCQEDWGTCVEETTCE